MLGDRDLQTYKLIPDAFMYIRKRLYLQSLKSIIVMIILFATISYYMKSLLGDLSFIFYILLTGYLILRIFKDYISIRRKWKEWTTYIIKIDNSTITKSQLNQKETTINLEDVSKIIEIPSTGLLIQSSFDNKIIFIPNSLNKFEVIKAKLHQIKPFESSSINVKDPAITTIFAIQPLKSPFNWLKKLLISFVIGLGILFLIVVGAIWFLSK
jgi:hypothetical protein